MRPASFQERLAEARQLLIAQDYSRALARYEKLTAEDPTLPSLWFEYGNAAMKCRQMPVAEGAWTRAIELAPRDAELISMVGHQYQGLRQPQKATELFARAASANPRGINPRISLAVHYEKNHRLADARAMVDECLRIEPREPQALYFSAVLDRRENKIASAESRLRDLIASEPRQPYVRYACRYELAQLLDRQDRYDEAMQWLREAKNIVRSLTDTKLLLRGYDKGAQAARDFTKALPKTILNTWAAAFPRDTRQAIPALAFVGGHPRSGTTLLEQVLDAHPGIAALDEPTAFIEVLQPEFHRSRELTPARLNTLRQIYIETLVGELGPEAAQKVLVDKNPSPTARLPLWLKVFPELHVVIALRDPRDVVLSCYFQNIPLNAANVNFLSFERLARHYADLMDIWLLVREWEGFHWIETRYEEMVTNLEKEGRRVTEFLRLEWHEEQGRFHEKSGRKQLYSPTYQDVTRPVYTRSVARWQAYEKYLAPILKHLKPYCDRLGYEG
jgi:tetratricopeptide (TPR) repeat protein